MTVYVRLLGAICFLLPLFWVNFSGATTDDIGSAKCIFKRPFIFGASISAGYKNPRDALKGGSQWTKKKTKHFGSHHSPTTRLAKKYFKSPVITNISEISGVMPYERRAYDQFTEALKDVHLSKKISQASVLASIDGFYWSAVHGHCNRAINGVEDIIRYGASTETPMILGTVPEDDPSEVSFLVRLVWSPPQPQCLTAINHALISLCTTDNHCYLMDFHKLINDLRNSEKGIQFEGTKNRASDFRSDGLHLSSKGTRYVMKLIEQSVVENPLGCASL